jgi:phosphoribosyl-ATP pyrophosphohydrolase/phosphoribosyl-AMP cyclohydrolase
MLSFDTNSLDFSKYENDLMPAIICCAKSNRVLMLGFMNKAALTETIASKQVVFFSRTRKALWRKGETSGNFLNVKQIECDCDFDSLIIYAKAAGPTCHTGTASCFNIQNNLVLKDNFLNELTATIKTRMGSANENSYVKKLQLAGTELMAAKVIEEAVEFAQASKKESRERCISEAADLLFHSLVMLKHKQISLSNVIGELAERNKA